MNGASCIVLQPPNQHQRTFLQLLRSSARRDTATPPVAIALSPQLCCYPPRNRMLANRALLLLEREEQGRLLLLAS